MFVKTDCETDGSFHGTSVNIGVSSGDAVGESFSMSIKCPCKFKIGKSK